MCRSDPSVIQLPRPLDQVFLMGPFTVTSAEPRRIAAATSHLSREKLGETAAGLLAGGLSTDASPVPGGTQFSPQSCSLTAVSGEKPLFRVKEQIIPQQGLQKDFSFTVEDWDSFQPVCGLSGGERPRFLPREAGRGH